MSRVGAYFDGEKVGKEVGVDEVVVSSTGFIISGDLYEFLKRVNFLGRYKEVSKVIK